MSVFCGSTISKIQVPVKNGMCFAYYVRSMPSGQTEIVLVFQSTGTLVPFGIPAESGRNVQPRPGDDEVFVCVFWCVERAQKLGREKNCDCILES